MDLQKLLAAVEAELARGVKGVRENMLQMSRDNLRARIAREDREARDDHLAEWAKA